MQSYHISFIILGLIVAVIIPALLTPTKTSVMAAANGSVWENIFDGRRAKVLRHAPGKKGEVDIEYIVDGNSDKTRLPARLFYNQYKQISKPK